TTKLSRAARTGSRDKQLLSSGVGLSGLLDRYGLECDGPLQRATNGELNKQQRSPEIAIFPDDTSHDSGCSIVPRRLDSPRSFIGLPVHSFYSFAIPGGSNDQAKPRRAHGKSG
ncbi:MAG: hypothetical protein ACRER2_11960, partial [Methylococcales bacterium]